MFYLLQLVFWIWLILVLDLLNFFVLALALFFTHLQT